MAKDANSFALGTAVGVALCALALAALLPNSPDSGFTGREAALLWVDQNLGASMWLFGAVLALYLFDLMRLRNKLSNTDNLELRDVAGLDQRLDVWGQLFIGIGVVWTAIGMRSALQAALGDGDLSGSASSVLKNLVDGGILLALTTTIVGGVGGYLMRLTKTVSVGSELQSFYESLDQAGVRALLQATQRIESHLRSVQNADPAPAATEVKPT